MEGIGNWVLGGVSAIMGIAGLFVASHAGAGVGYYGGLAEFVFAMGFIFWLIKSGFDHHEE